MNGKQFNLDPRWAAGAVIATALVAAGFLVQDARQNPDLPVFEIVARLSVTTVTGLWFAARLAYTQTYGARRPSYGSYLMSTLIALSGLSCFLFVFTPWWFVPASLTLCLAIQKDLEVVLFRGRQTRDQNVPRVARVVARMVVCHHYYSMIRDLSLAVWWIVYGVLVLTTSVSPRLLAALFGAPYVVLVVFWILLKGAVDRAEEALEDISQSGTA